MQCLFILLNYQNGFIVSKSVQKIGTSKIIQSDKLSTFGFAQMKRLIISVGSLLKLSSDDSTRIAAFQFSSKGLDFLSILRAFRKRPITEFLGETLEKGIMNSSR